MAQGDKKRARRGVGMLIWGLALLVSGAAEAATSTRKTAFEYDPVTGLLTKEVVEPLTAFELATTYTYDASGNRIQAVTGSGVAARTVTSTFDPQARFSVQSQNPLLHSETRTFDSLTGAPETVTGPNGLTTTILYDSFGRKTAEIAPDGTRVTTKYRYCQGVASGTEVCPPLAKYVVISAQYKGANGETKIGAETKVYMDALNRQLRSQTEGFATNDVSTVDIEYDNRGRVVRQSEPYLAGDPMLWTASTYDVLDRPLVVRETDAAGNTLFVASTTVYSGLTVTVSRTDPARSLTLTVTTVKDSQGQVKSVTDADGNVVSYDYDPFGNLVQTIAPERVAGVPNRIKASFDKRGQRIQLNDPDLGIRTYTYDAFGQLLTETNVNAGTSTAYTYDKLGRMLTRQESDLLTTWTYDVGAMAIGKLSSMTAANPSGGGVATLATGYSRTFTYDSLGRPRWTDETLDGGVSGRTSQSYDSNGRPRTLTLPSGQVLTHIYTSRGYLKDIRNNTGGIMWETLAVNAAGAITEERFGNGAVTKRTVDRARGVVTAINSRSSSSATTDDLQSLEYQYDAFLNMTWRTDHLEGSTESFTFDKLNRLTASQVAGFTGVAVTYDALGNIKSKSDVGRYYYDSSGARPHAVVRIREMTTSTVVSDFAYDAGGNMTSSTGRTVAWTSFDMPSLITKGAATVQFLYGPDHERVKQVKPAEVTHYMAGGVVERVVAGGVTTWTTYVTAGDSLVGTLTRVEGQQEPEAATARYFHLDHLGSVDRISGDLGAVVERLDFDPWGKRRYANGAPDTVGAIASSTRRGFTGHEQLDTVGLVHMNGRVYDPVVARFLSADPMLQSPYNLQSYNRYSYALNNPLSYTDPSGFFSVGKFFKKLFKGIWKFMVGLHKFAFSRQGLAIAAAIAIIWLTGGFAAPGVAGPLGFNAGIVASGALAGAASGAIATGTLKGAIFGAISGAISGAIAYAIPGTDTGAILGRGFANATSQGIVAGAQGGDFRAAFLSAGFASIAGAALPKNIYAQAIGRTIIGGTAAEIGGGKFANGAYSAAFQYAVERGVQAGEQAFRGGQSAARQPITGGPKGPGIQFLNANESDIAEFNAARAYLSVDAEAAAIFARADAEGLVVDINHDMVASAYVGLKVITWDPYTAMATSDGLNQTPAMGLYHEMQHAFGDPSAPIIIMPIWGSSEELRVISQFETPLARRLGEGVRNEYLRPMYKVNCSICR